MRVHLTCRKPERELTCTSEELAELNREKDDKCNDGSSSCRDKEIIDCDVIKDYYKKHSECIEIRKRITDECYGGIADAGHETQIVERKAAQRTCKKRWKELKCEGDITNY